ncbi:hypothetical protein [Catellatospora sichuanensis]|uniref:hypothetical protein n=1 Tax=Catellatospora sichuanensis TaxID=1969805 RepID=UPI0011824DA3|nr:hypothetical protein [Catellatospora sichuanensis]
MTDPTHPRPSWLRETVALLRNHWWTLLAIIVVTELAALLAGVAVPLAVYGGGDRLSVLDDSVRLAVVTAVPFALAGVFNAWTWAAVVEMFRGAGEGRRVRFGAALRRGVRRSGRLALWLGGVGLLRAAGSVYMFHALLDGYGTRGFQTTSAVMTAGSWYLTFATALLPLVVLFERRGLGRAWRLAHSRAATIGQIVAVLAFGLAVDNLADLVMTQLRPGAGYVWPVGVQVATISAVGVLTATVTMTALTVAYLRRVALPAAPDPEPAPDAPEPVVIELGRTW